MILLDTHTLYWLATDNQQLGTLSRNRIHQALGDEGAAVSAISFWELAMLAAKKRIEVDDIEDMRRAILETSIIELPLDGTIAILAAQLEDLHKDPADRFIAATAMRRNATLITADEKLLAGPPALKRHDART